VLDRRGASETEACRSIRCARDSSSTWSSSSTRPSSMSGLRDAWEAGAVMTGGSAGGLCWFEGGTTDSFGPELKVLV
jgi:hypothetical protein